MKASTLLTLLTSTLALATSPSLSAREAECGALGVMDTSDLPAGTDLSQVRTCRDHPDSLVNPARYAAEGLVKRKCENFAKGAHCSKTKFCYVNCGDPKQAKWCWLAGNGGSGDWLTCSSDKECNLKQNKQNGQCGMSKTGSQTCKGCGCHC